LKKEKYRAFAGPVVSYPFLQVHSASDYLAFKFLDLLESPPRGWVVPQNRGRLQRDQRPSCRGKRRGV